MKERGFLAFRSPAFRLTYEKNRRASRVAMKRPSGVISARKLFDGKSMARFKEKFSFKNIFRLDLRHAKRIFIVSICSNMRIRKKGRQKGILKFIDTLYVYYHKTLFSFFQGIFVLRQINQIKKSYLDEKPKLELFFFPFPSKTFSVIPIPANILLSFNEFVEREKKIKAPARYFLITKSFRSQA
jgi:hypothetical protein